MQFTCRCSVHNSVCVLVLFIFQSICFLQQLLRRLLALSAHPALLLGSLATAHIYFCVALYLLDRWTVLTTPQMSFSTPAQFYLLVAGRRAAQLAGAEALEAILHERALRCWY